MRLRVEETGAAIMTVLGMLSAMCSTGRPADDPGGESWERELYSDSDADSDIDSETNTDEIAEEYVLDCGPSGVALESAGPPGDRAPRVRLERWPETAFR